jgi:hypothetical protein
MNLSEADRAYLISFVEEVLVVCKNDFDRVTYGLDDMALNAGAILGLSKEYMESLD